MPVLQPLLAAGFEELLKALVPIVFLVLWVLSQISRAKQAQEEIAEGEEEEHDEQVQQDLRAEIERFLRQAAGQPEPPQMAETAETVEMPVDAVPVDAAPVVAEVAERTSVADHVRQHLATDGFRDRPQHLGGQVEQTNERTDARIHKKFDHAIGRLDEQEPAHAGHPDMDAEPRPKTKPRNYTATQLAEMLKNPQTAQQAILMGEIFRRPDRF